MSGHFVFLAEDYDDYYRNCKDAEQSYVNCKYEDCKIKACNLVKDVFAIMGLTLLEALNIDKFYCISESLKNIIDLSNQKQQANEQDAMKALNSLVDIMIWYVTCIEKKDFRQGLFLPEDFVLVKKHLDNRSSTQIKEQHAFESELSVMKSDEQIIEKVIVDTIHKQNGKEMFITRYGKYIVCFLIFFIAIGIGFILLGFGRDKVVKQDSLPSKLNTQDKNNEIVQTQSNSNKLEKKEDDKPQPVNYQNTPNRGYMSGLREPFHRREDIVSWNLKKSNVVKVDTFNPTNEYEEFALQGYANAQYYLAFCYLMGYQISQDLSKAQFWYEKASNQGLYEASWILNEIKKGNTSKLLKKRDCPCYKIDIPDEADQYYLKYYFLKNEREILLMQLIDQNNKLLATKRQLLFNGEKVNPELEKNINEVQKSLNYLRGDYQEAMNENLIKAADRGHYYAQYLVGLDFDKAFMMSKYKDVEKGKKAFDYLKKSSDKGFYYAMAALAPMYNSLAYEWNGIVKKNVELSNSLKSKAKRLEEKCKGECFDLQTIRTIKISQY
jgi:TPR repeat protein